MPDPSVVYEDEYVTLWHGDARHWLLGYADPSADAIITDPPYGDTSLVWDKLTDGWVDRTMAMAPQLWVFGSMRSHFATHAEFVGAGWTYAQEIIWEKHNGSGFHADRFKRVHEIAVHWYRGAWGDLYCDPPRTMDATARTVRRKARPAHTGHIEDSSYASDDGGPRLQRSVIQVRSEHGRAVHPTQKPLGIMRPLIEFSVPPAGLVLDPFAGSGSTLLAAREMGRRAQGCEIDADYCKAAIKRLAQRTLEGVA